MIGIRLREERERLGYTQAAFAGLADATQRTIISWEKGDSSPTTVQLAALAKVGLDVLYVVTGQRMHPIQDTTDPSEKFLLENYRRAPIYKRAFIQDAAEMAALVPRRKLA